VEDPQPSLCLLSLATVANCCQRGEDKDILAKSMQELVLFLMAKNLSCGSCTGRWIADVENTAASSSFSNEGAAAIAKRISSGNRSKIPRVDAMVM